MSYKHTDFFHLLNHGVYIAICLPAYLCICLSIYHLVDVGITGQFLGSFPFTLLRQGISCFCFSVA